MTTTAKPSTITVRGHRVSNRTTRRYSMIVVRPEPKPTADGTGYYVAFADVRKRSDNLPRLRKAAAAFGYAHGAFAVVVDTETGAEV